MGEALRQIRLVLYRVKNKLEDDLISALAYLADEAERYLRTGE